MTRQKTVAGVHAPGPRPTILGAALMAGLMGCLGTIPLVGIILLL